MITMVTVSVALWLLVIFGGFCLWVLQMGCEYETWQNDVTVDDLKELDKVFKNEN